MAGQRVDENLVHVIEDLYTLQRRLQSSPDEGHEHDRLMDATSTYLLANAGLIEIAVEAWAATPEEDLRRLQSEHRELDGSATRHDFRGIATQALQSAWQIRQPDGVPRLFPITDDDLHMLDRVLEFAKYLVDTSHLPTQWHPVEQLLDDEKALRAALKELVWPERAPAHPPEERELVDTLEEGDAPVEVAETPFEDETPTRRRREQVEWVPDAPATEDLLNRKPLSDALARRLRRVDRDRPTGSFLVHLDGAWGSGKSTILNFLRQDLEAGREPWLVVDFNAWQQARLGPAWWTLITALRDRMTRDVGLLERWRLRSAELWQRARRTGAPYALALVLLVLLVAGIVIALKPADPLASAGDIAKTITAVAAAVGVLWTGALFVSRVFLWESPVGARLYERSNDNPMAYLNRHFGWLVSRVGRPVVFFVDDLDRCEHSYVVEFLDALQTLVRDAPLARARPRGRAPTGPYFVVAADGGWIRASYDAAYAGATGALVEPGQTLGHLFLDKMFQLTVTVPSLSRTRQATFLRHLLNAQDGALEVLRVEQARVEERIRESRTQSEVRRAWEQASPLVQEAVARVAVARLTDEEVQSETEHELEKFSPLLDRNPRRMKRFLNVYTVELISSGLEGNFVDPDSLALWTILRMRWPMLSDFLRVKPEAIECFGGERALPEGLAVNVRAAFELREVADVVHFVEGGPLTAALVEELTGRGALASRTTTGPA